MTHSPLPKKKRPVTAVPTAPIKEAVFRGINFADAMIYIIAGKKVARASWPDPIEHCLLKDGFLMIHRPDRIYYRWNIAEQDMKANDWKVVV